MTKARALTLCLNSLMKLNYLEDELSFYIVCIDEVASFLELTHNDTLDSNIRSIFVLLLRLVKFAFNVIVSDASINDALRELLKGRNGFGKPLYIESVFKQYKDISVIRIRDENEFLDKVLERCQANKYFLFGCDSNNVITKFYQTCISEAQESDKDKYY